MRELCLKCRRALLTCYCAKIIPFATGPEFVILLHPRESRKRIGTGRMTKLCLKNARLIEGVDFTHHPEINRLLDEESLFPMVLYPGSNAFDLSLENDQDLEDLVPANKKLVIFVIDATWYCAKKMLKVSKNLKALPQICFTPPRKSAYQIRQQPQEICFSTVEAVHYMIEKLNASARWCSEPGHENLMHVFQHMVSQQLAFAEKSGGRAIRGLRA